MYKNKYSNKIAYDKVDAYKKHPIKHVILFGVDGLGGYAFKEKGKTFFKEVLKDSAYTFEGRNVFPTETAQNWATIFTGSTVPQHGYTNWFSDYPEIPPVICNEYDRYPTIFYLLKTQIKDSKVASFYTYPGIGSLYEHQIFDVNTKLSNDKETVDNAIKYFISNKPMLMNITLDEVDGAGHEKGHNTKDYYDAVKKTETYFNKLVSSLKENNLLDETLIIVCSDHGGFKKGHGPGDATDRKELSELYRYSLEVPIIFYNKNIKVKGEFKTQIFNWDIAPTIASIFKLKIPNMWIGKKVEKLLKK